jgi:hypothetical protein
VAGWSGSAAARLAAGAADARVGFDRNSGRGDLFRGTPMRRTGLAPLLAAALLLGGLTGGAQAASRTSVKVTECQVGKTQETRLATFQGRMRAVKGTARMAMRFALVAETTATASPQIVDAPALSPWRRSRSGVSEFTYAQTIKGLAPGVTYRSVVSYRWYDAKGRIIERAERRSGTCVQDGDLPNLVLASVKSARGGVEGTGVYTVSVGNTGHGDVEAFTVSLIADGAHIDTRTIDGLKAGEFTTVRFTGPYCRRLRAVVDRGQDIPETVEDDNGLKARC